jgi:Na+/H+ antiporter NhaA
VLGLFLGKPIGITLASWLAVRARQGALPHGITWVQLHAAGWLGGIGFTMSIFVAGLAFSNEALLNMAKLGIFTGSLLAGVAGSVFLLGQSLKFRVVARPSGRTVASGLAAGQPAPGLMSAVEPRQVDEDA